MKVTQASRQPICISRLKKKSSIPSNPHNNNNSN